VNASSCKSHSCWVCSLALNDNSHTGGHPACARTVLAHSSQRDCHGCRVIWPPQVATMLVDLYRETQGLAWASAWLDDQALPSAPRGACAFDAAPACASVAPLWLLRGPLWLLRGPLWLLRGPLWLLHGPCGFYMGPVAFTWALWLLHGPCGFCVGQCSAGHPSPALAPRQSAGKQAC